MSNHEINIEADCVAEKLAAILEAVDKDCTDDAHMTEPGAHGLSRVIRNGIHNAREYLTSEFLELLEAEILRTQWNEDYFRNRPFAVRLNGEDFGTFRLLEEARKCFDNVEKIYNR